MPHDEPLTITIEALLAQIDLELAAHQDEQPLPWELPADPAETEAGA